MANFYGTSCKPPPYNPGYQQGYQQGYLPPQAQVGYQAQAYTHQGNGYQAIACNQASPGVSNNVLVVQPTARPVEQVYVEDNTPNHLLHAIITLFFWPWIFVWLLLCLVYGV